MLFESQVVAAELPALTSAPTASKMPRPRQARRIAKAPRTLRMNDVYIATCLRYSLVVIPTANVFWINNGDEYDLRSIQTLPDTAYRALTENRFGSFIGDKRLLVFGSIMGSSTSANLPSGRSAGVMRCRIW
jgi:hypothetical protein